MNRKGGEELGAFGVLGQSRLKRNSSSDGVKKEVTCDFEVRIVSCIICYCNKMAESGYFIKRFIES